MEKLIRYIHGNPLRSGICKSIQQLDRYPWSGHAVLMGNKRRDFQDTKTVLRLFGVKDPEARRSYRRFIGESGKKEADKAFVSGIRNSNREGAAGKDVSSWVLGDPDFVQNALKNDKENRLMLQEYKKRGWSVAHVVGTMSGRLGITEEELLRRSRETIRSDARKVVFAIANRQFGIPTIEIARYFRITTPAVSHMLDKGEAWAKKKRLWDDLLPKTDAK